MCPINITFTHLLLRLGALFVVVVVVVVVVVIIVEKSPFYTNKFEETCISLRKKSLIFFL